MGSCCAGWVGRTKRSHLGRRPSAGGIQDESADAIAAIGVRELDDCVWAIKFRELHWLSLEMSREGRAPFRELFLGGLFVEQTRNGYKSRAGYL